LENEAEFISQLINNKTKEKAFSQLLDLYQERLYWHIRKIVLTHDNANDVLQNTFIRIFKGLRNFSQKSSLHTWMYRIAYNEALRFLAENKRKSFLSIEEFTQKSLNTLSDDSFFEGDDAQIKLHNILLGLPERERIIFQMKYFDDLKFREIEEILNIKEGTLKSSYYNTVKIIEKNILNVELFLKNKV
jgi:RNA polymerase sigma-70 factor (ECF subfamily)